MENHSASSFSHREVQELHRRHLLQMGTLKEKSTLWSLAMVVRDQCVDSVTSVCNALIMTSVANVKRMAFIQVTQ